MQEFLANVEIMDRFIKETVSVCDAVAAKRKSSKRLMLSIDEWNVWYKARSGEHMAKPGWPVAPRLIEEVYDLQDALMVGGALITLLNNADRVKVACQAQLVNVIGVIFTEPGGAAWRQTIFHPFRIVAEHAQGSVLEAKVQCDQHETKTAGAVDDLVVAAVHDSARTEGRLLYLESFDKRSCGGFARLARASRADGMQRGCNLGSGSSRGQFRRRPTILFQRNTMNSRSKPTKLLRHCVLFRGICYPSPADSASFLFSP